MTNVQQQLQKGWNQSECHDWYQRVITQGKVRDYRDIDSRVTRLPANTHSVKTYAAVEGHSVFCITVGDPGNNKPNILITGGVHGYEPSGVEAAIRFLEEEAPSLTKEFNFVVYPCISPWAYEYDQRWNPEAEDPNRLFTKTPKLTRPHVFRTPDIKECCHFMNSMEANSITFTCAIDLHETSDRDIELRLMRTNRFDEELSSDYTHIPQGYYLTLSKRDTDEENKRQFAFGKSIIDEVRKHSPIAPELTILNGKDNHGGIILSASSDGLMRTYLDHHAKLVAVTEVYPDHINMTAEKTVRAQLASIRGALNYVRAQNTSP